MLLRPDILWRVEIWKKRIRIEGKDPTLVIRWHQHSLFEIFPYLFMTLRGLAYVLLWILGPREPWIGIFFLLIFIVPLFLLRAGILDSCNLETITVDRTMITRQVTGEVATEIEFKHVSEIFSRSGEMGYSIGILGPRSSIMVWQSRDRWWKFEQEMKQLFLFLGAMAAKYPRICLSDPAGWIREKSLLKSIPQRMPTSS